MHDDVASPAHWLQSGPEKRTLLDFKSSVKESCLQLKVSGVEGVL